MYLRGTDSQYLLTHLNLKLTGFFELEIKKLFINKREGCNFFFTHINYGEKINLQ